MATQVKGAVTPSSTIDPLPVVTTSDINFVGISGKASAHYVPATITTTTQSLIDNAGNLKRSLRTSNMSWPMQIA